MERKTSMAHDVFISYASGDKTVADAVCAKLEATGIRCWIAPRDVLPGVHYGEAIIDAIHECRIMVLVFSSKANLSGHIPKEIERAVSAGVTVMPLRIEDVAPAKSLDYFIGSVHWLDALTPPLEVHLQKLAANVQTLLSRSVQGSDVRPQPPITPSPVRAMPTATTAVPQAARPAWAYAVIGGLTAVILMLGLLMFWFRSQGRPSTLQAGSQAGGNVPPSQPVEHTTSVPDSSKPPAVVKPQLAAAIAPKKDVVPTTPGAKTSSVLLYVPGSTVKLEQLVGEEDKELHQPTRNPTFSRYGLQGTDLGYSFEHQGQAYFLFGTTVGRFPRALGTIATTDASDPESGVKLDFLTSGNRYLTVETSDDTRATRRNVVGELKVPVSGISLGGQMYVVVSTSHPLDRTADQSVLTKFTAPAVFQPLHPISQLPAGRFIRMSMHAEPGPISGLPPGGPFVIAWGTGAYRKSDAYLSILPVTEFESGKGIRYFAGLDAKGAPSWSESESDAKPIIENGTLGDLSVTWSKDLGLWLMTYDSREPSVGILFSYSRTPWGPWSEPQVLFNIVRDGAFGKFIHNPQAKPDDGLAGPVFGPKNQADPSAVRGGAYAPYVVERWTKVQGSELNLYYVISTSNPYVVVLMKSRLKVE
jgi:hypothetical protein